MRRRNEEDDHGRVIPPTRSWWRPITVKGDLRGESIMATLQCGAEEPWWSGIKKNDCEDQGAERKAEDVTGWSAHEHT